MVTVLLATYNGEKYLEEQLNSLIEQTYTDFRIVIRDDGSSDNTNEIISRYSSVFPDKIIVCPYTEPTRSAAGNFFKLIEMYDDNYIMLCDQDDRWLPDKIEKTLSAMQTAEEKYGADTPILVHTDLFVADEKLRVTANSFIKYQGLSSDNTSLNRLLMQNSVTGCTTMFNRALKEKLFILPKVTAMHDWWLALIASAFGEIEFLNEPTILYRQHGNNEVGAKDYRSLSFLMGKLKNLKKTKETYKIISLQAEFLLKNYAELLDIKQKKLLEAVATLPQKSKIEKIKTIKKHRLYKNTALRNLVQFILI